MDSGTPPGDVLKQREELAVLLDISENWLVEAKAQLNLTLKATGPITDQQMDLIRSDLYRLQRSAAGFLHTVEVVSKGRARPGHAPSDRFSDRAVTQDYPERLTPKPE